MITVETPPRFSEVPEEQLRQMMSYLFRLSENLNVALNSLTADDFAPGQEAAAAATAGGSSGSTAGGGGQGGAGGSYNELRALITNTANYVKAEEKRLENEYTARYAALSDDWGQFQENIGHTVESTARGVVDSYGYDASIQTLNDKAAGFEDYKIHTEGFIRQGFIDYDEGGAPVIGIAIGQGLTSTEVTIDGETYQQFDSTQSCAFYTADRVSFRLNGQEVAYISNRKLYIGDADITGTMTFGQWLLTHDAGYTIRWIGA